MDTITVHFKNGRQWKFEWSSAGHSFLYNTGKNTYRLFIEDNPYKQIWIGRFAVRPDGGGCWFTDERRLGAVKAVFDNGEFHFDQRDGRLRHLDR